MFPVGHDIHSALFLPLINQINVYRVYSFSRSVCLFPPCLVIWPMMFSFAVGKKDKTVYKYVLGICCGVFPASGCPLSG